MRVAAKTVALKVLERDSLSVLHVFVFASGDQLIEAIRLNSICRRPGKPDEAYRLPTEEPIPFCFRSRKTRSELFLTRFVYKISAENSSDHPI